MAYRLWQNNVAQPHPTVLCAHGINQNSRHFDALAIRLVSDFDLLVPDYPGRGLSDPLDDKLNYTHENYAALFLAFFETMHFREIDWLGISMGGITGILLASRPDTPIRKLVLNDVGPIVPKATRQLSVLAAQAGPRRFASLEEAMEKMGPYTRNFGITDPAMKEAFISAGLRQDAEGFWHPDFDHGIYQRSRLHPEIAQEDAPFWQYWDTVRCPVLVLHGVNSTTLTPDIITQMQRTHPDLEVIDIPETGHAPHLMSDDQAELIRRWLLR